MQSAAIPTIPAKLQLVEKLSLMRKEHVEKSLEPRRCFTQFAPEIPSNVISSMKTRENNESLPNSTFETVRASRADYFGF
eukprot:IDg4557t1